eukprot:6264969-Lingulodinium_polyedra.AAC.1
MVAPPARSPHAGLRPAARCAVALRWPALRPRSRLSARPSRRCWARSRRWSHSTRPAQQGPAQTSAL